MICTLFTSKEGIFMRYSYEFKRKCVAFQLNRYLKAEDGIFMEDLETSEI